MQLVSPLESGEIYGKGTKHARQPSGTISMLEHRWSIPRGLLRAFDDKDFDRTSRRFQFESELFLNGRE